MIRNVETPYSISSVSDNVKSIQLLSLHTCTGDNAWRNSCANGLLTAKGTKKRIENDEYIAADSIIMATKDV
jgi:hypothetical protein